MSPVKTAEPIKMSFGTWTRVGPRKHVLDRGAHWRNLANTIQPSLCSRVVAFLSNYFDHLFSDSEDSHYTRIIFSVHRFCDVPEQITARLGLCSEID